MGHYIVLFVFWCFIAFAVALVIRALIASFSAPAADTPKTIVVEHQPVHEHEWREVTPFVRQCRFRECSKVEFGDSVPDGMMDYVNLMTSRQARVDPNGEASHYSELDPRAWGPKCPTCDRVIGFPWSLPASPFGIASQLNCPYCQEVLSFNDTEKKWERHLS